MKKSIVALAVMGAFSGAALAQSSVTLYGIVDVGYQWYEVPTVTGTGTATRIQQESTSAINGGYQSGNRWGLRGSEALGGGWSAIFTLESGFNIDTGTMGNSNATTAQGSAATATAAGRLFGRQAYAGVNSNFGTLVLGRLATFSSGTGDFDMFGRVDPFSTGFGLAGLQNTFISANSLRADNAIAYRSPKFAGFQGGVGYSTNTNGQEVTPSDQNAKLFFSGLGWEFGPFYASLTYDSLNAPSTPTFNPPNQKNLQIGGVLTLGNFTINGAYADQTDIAALQQSTFAGSGSFIALPAGLNNFDATSYMIGGTWKMGAWLFMASYQWFNADGKQVRATPTSPVVNFEPDYDVWGLAATYNFSRRTNLYVGYGMRNANGTLQGDQADAKQFALGLRHLF